MTQMCINEKLDESIRLLSRGSLVQIQSGSPSYLHDNAKESYQSGHSLLEMQLLVINGYRWFLGLSIRELLGVFPKKIADHFQARVRRLSSPSPRWSLVKKITNHHTSSTHKAIALGFTWFQLGGIHRG